MSSPPCRRLSAPDHIVEEMVMRFTHTIEMDWLLPGVRPTGRSAEFALACVIRFEAGKVASEHLYWDQGDHLDLKQEMVAADPGEAVCDQGE
jgi:carboxymethylenebutenolidase